MSKKDTIADTLMRVREFRVKAQMMAEEATEIEKELERIHVLQGEVPGKKAGIHLTNAELAKLGSRADKELVAARLNS